MFVSCVIYPTGISVVLHLPALFEGPARASAAQLGSTAQYDAAARTLCWQLGSDVENESLAGAFILSAGVQACATALAQVVADVRMEGVPGECLG